MSTSVWDEFEFDPRSAQYGSLRASDADRDVVHRLLGGAYADGRINREEFDERSEAVLGARTLAELPALMSDLVPVSGLPARRAVPAEDECGAPGPGGRGLPRGRPGGRLGLRVGLDRLLGDLGGHVRQRWLPVARLRDARAPACTSCACW